MERQAVLLDALFFGFCRLLGSIKVKLKFTCKFPKVIAKRLYFSNL